MTKKRNTPLNIFMESLRLYFSNFDKFVKYMTFPVLGQFVGLSLVFALTYFYSKNMSLVVEKFSVLNNLLYLVLILLLLILPGMMIFLKAFWEYLIAYGSVNSMLENMLKSGKVYDFDAHTDLIKRRTVSFVGLWCLVGLFSLLSTIPFFWVPAGVFAIFFILIFQVFTFEPELSPIGCAKRSLQLIKGHFASTFMLVALVGALTYILVPKIFSLFFDYTNLTLFFSKLINPMVSQLPLVDWNSVLSYLYLEPIVAEKLSLTIVSLTLTQIVVQFSLPLRSIVFAMWYKELNGGKLYIAKEDRPKQKTRAKKPSEKLMEESHKKFASKKITPKKLDKNILRRAMEKDE